MAQRMLVNDAGRKGNYLTRLWADLKRNKLVYLMWLPVLIYYLVFHYAPMFGVVIAFENYKPFKGILGSNFVGLQWFRDFLSGPFAWRTISNTLILSFYQILFGFPMPILLALLINELKGKRFKKTVQTVSYMPHFISLIVICGLLTDFAASTGLFNAITRLFGIPKANYLVLPSAYRSIYVGSGIWKQMGWGSIIYLATLSGIDPNLYEAAAIDGANRFKRMLHVTLPALVPIIVMQLIMRMGHVMSEGSEKTILLYNESTYSVSDIVSSFVYRRGLLSNDYSYGAAVGLFNSLVNIVLLTTANTLSRRMTNESLW